MTRSLHREPQPLGRHCVECGACARWLCRTIGRRKYGRFRCDVHAFEWAARYNVPLPQVTR